MKKRRSVYSQLYSATNLMILKWINKYFFHKLFSVGLYDYKNMSDMSHRQKK